MFKKLKFWVVLLLVLLTAVGCATSTATQKPLPTQTPQPPAPEVVVTVLTVEVEKEVTRQVEVTAAPSDTPSVQLTEEPLRLTVGNEEHRRGVTDHECYDADINVGGGYIKLLLAGQTYPILGQSSRTTEHVVAIKYGDGAKDICWLSEFQVTLPEGVSWDDVPIYP